MHFRLLMLLLAFGLVACSTGRRGGGGTGDDDDSGDDDDAADDDDVFNPDDDDDAVDDDDATPNPDDDDATPSPDDDDATPQPDDDDATPTPDDDDATSPPDDDDATPNPSACTGSPLYLTEQEPNDGTSETDIHDIGTTDAYEVVISGEFANCANDGNTWTGDGDYFAIDLDCTADLSAELTWDNTTADADFNVLAADVDPNNYVLTGYNYSTTPPESEGPVTVFGGLVAGVLCWEGPSGTPWQLTLTFD